ncbi:MAG: hypothetical protein WD844_01185 [Thermoleophilaceae bacterium]
MTRRRIRALVTGAAAAAVLGGGAFALAGGDGSAPAPSSATAASEDPDRPRPQVVDVIGPGDNAEDAAQPAGPAGVEGDISDPGRPSPGAPSDADVTDELARLKKVAGGRARITGDGQAVAPFDAPEAVQRIIAAGNIISRSPYKWGGGHGRWLDDGYDCSGSVSFALAAAGLLESPLVSGALARWGEDGEGRWVTIYANDGHVYMNVAGLRFDTSGRDSRNGGSRWQPELRSGGGFAVRHPRGL